MTAKALRICHTCGLHEDQPAAVGYQWVAPNLCSACHACEPDLRVQMNDTATAILCARVRLTTEKQTQSDLAHVFAVDGTPAEREVRLAPGDIIDLIVRGRVGVEVKLKHARPADIVRQLERYATSPRIAGLLLATNRAMNLPGSMNGKPVRVVSLGRGWM